MHTTSISWIIVHVVAAFVAFALGVYALRVKPGSVAHRRAGKGYLVSWVALALFGAMMGHQHPDVSAFEILNAIGGTTVALGYAPVLIPAMRRALAGADGRGWMRWHLRFMVGSMPFLVVAGVNQVLPLLGVPYSMPLLAASIVVGTVVARTMIRKLLRQNELMPSRRQSP